MRHRNQLNLVKHRQLRSATKPAIGPVGDEGNNRVARLYARPDSSCSRCGYLRCDGHPKKETAPEPKQAPFAVGDVVRCAIGTRGKEWPLDSKERVIAHVDDIDYGSGGRQRLGFGCDVRHLYFSDRFELVRRAGEAKEGELPSGWRDDSRGLHEADRAGGDRLYRHESGASVRLFDAGTMRQWFAYPGGEKTRMGFKVDATTRDEAMRLALEGRPSA